MLIRNESEADHELVRKLYIEAFDTPAEADLVEQLRAVSPLVSLVLEEGMRLVGHIMFTPVSLEGFPGLNIMGLAPMAVVPDRQNCGFGSALVEEGLVRCRASESGAVVVLGHPGFYPRFGFRPASDAGINCQYDVPADVFMVLELEPGYLGQSSGCIRYNAAFGNL